MDRIITCLWDFRGLRSKGIAEHFLEHVQEFLQKNQINWQNCEVKEVNSTHHQASLKINSTYQDIIQKALKPAQIVTE